jgi:type VI secretion system protein ImpA
MASVPTVDIDAILKPISGDKPCGVDPRDGVSFELLKEARREEDAASQGDWKREVKVADWPKVIQIATKVLSTEGKDLQVVAWLAEGLVKKHASAGLRDGLKVLRGVARAVLGSFLPRDRRRRSGISRWTTRRAEQDLADRHPQHASDSSTRRAGVQLLAV